MIGEHHQHRRAPVAAAFARSDPTRERHRLEASAPHAGTAASTASCDIQPNRRNWTAEGIAARLTLGKGLLILYHKQNVAGMSRGVSMFLLTAGLANLRLAPILPARGGHSYVHARSGLAWH